MAVSKAELKKHFLDKLHQILSSKANRVIQAKRQDPQHYAKYGISHLKIEIQQVIDDAIHFATGKTLNKYVNHPQVTPEAFQQATKTLNELAVETLPTLIDRDKRGSEALKDLAQKAKEVADKIDVRHPIVAFAEDHQESIKWGAGAALFFTAFAVTAKAVYDSCRENIHPSRPS